MITISNLAQILLRKYVISSSLFNQLLDLKHRENWDEKDLLGSDPLMGDLQKEMQDHMLTIK
jgi:hypothetical protein